MTSPIANPATVITLLSFGLVLDVVSTEAQTLAPEKIQRIEALLTHKMNADDIPALSIAIVVDGRLDWTEGFGLADIENSVSATAATAYRTASVGKTITATAVMQLVERGRIDLDAPVRRYCQAFPEKRWPLTTRHLLGHLGGIRHYGGPNNDEELVSNRHYDNVVDALDIFKDDPLLHEPGTKYLYSTYGYNVLGCVVEGASGTGFMDYLQANIFDPAGMSQTRDDDPSSLIPHRARGYLRSPAGDLLNAVAVDMSNKMPAGGYISTAGDLARFAAAAMNGDLVSESTLEMMLTPQVTTAGDTVAYGLGWGLFPGEDWYGEKEAFHGGGTPGVSAFLYMIPRRRFAVAFQMNVEGVSERAQLAGEIARLVLDLGR